MILWGKYCLKDDISEEARDLIRGMLEWDPNKRLTTEQILQSKWFDNVDLNIEIFSDEEKSVINREFTYNL